MRQLFLSDGNDRRSSYGGGNLVRKNESASLFWWTIVITLMMGLATFCWFFSIMVTQHPEKPMNYKVLAKLDRLPVIRKFSVYSVPDGSSKSARELLSAYFAYSPEQLQVANTILKRAYIRNYDKQDPPVYLSGQFEVLDARPLGEEDVVSEGWVVRCRAADLEDVDVEVLLPGLQSKAAPFEAGELLTLDKRSTFAALVHVQRINEDRLCATAVPLVYGGFKTAAGEVPTMSPPRRLNLEASWPVTKDPGVTAKMVSLEARP